jgi:hypothetical protein
MQRTTNDSDSLQVPRISFHKLQGHIPFRTAPLNWKSTARNSQGIGHCEDYCLYAHENDAQCQQHKRSHGVELSSGLRIKFEPHKRTLYNFTKGNATEDGVVLLFDKHPCRSAGLALPQSYLCPHLWGPKPYLLNCEWS